MDKKNLMPQQVQPIERITTGQLPELLAELSEELLYGDTSGSASVLPLGYCIPVGSNICSNDSGTKLTFCSYEGEDAE